MSTAWIQVFILTFAECVAPQGKTVCQEQQWELQFLTRADCEYALQQLLTTKDESERVIVDRQKSGCTRSVVEVEVQDNVAPAAASASPQQENRSEASPDDIDGRRQTVNQDHLQRLQNLTSCEENNYVSPCRVGDIIVEDATGDSVDVWQRE